MPSRFSILPNAVALLLAELREPCANGFHCRILHKYRRPGTDCAAGEDIAGASSLFGVREDAMPMSGGLLVMFDYMARHSHLPQTAAQIVRGLASNPFYLKLGSNAPVAGVRIPKVSLSEVRVYVQRIRQAIERVSKKAGRELEGRAVLVSERTESNRIAYRLKGTFEWVHIDHPRCPDGC